MLVYCFDAKELEEVVNEVIEGLGANEYLDRIVEGRKEVMSWNEHDNTITYIDGSTQPFVNSFFTFAFVTND